MEKSRFTEVQIRALFKQHEVGAPVADLSREHKVSTALSFQWRSRFGGMETSIMHCLNALEARKFTTQMPREALEKIAINRGRLGCNAISTSGDGQESCDQPRHQYPAGLSGVH